MPDHRPVIERFWSRVDRTPTCWLWTGALTGGYGRIRVGDRRIGAHAFAYETFVGSLPDGTELDHLCRTPRCVRPTHLDPVPHRINVLRGAGLAAAQVKRTICPRGHLYSIENTMMEGRRRRCRICRTEGSREAVRRYRARQRVSPIS